MKARSLILVALFLTSAVPLSTAEDPVEITILTDWGDDHAYIVTGDVNLSEVNATHSRNGSLLDIGLIYDTTGTDLRLELNSTLEYEDIITVTVGEFSRTITVGLWGQPLADHEVTTTTQWTMDQQWTNEFGPQKYILTFDGNGWQAREGNILEAWEMGDGALQITSNTDDGGIILNLILESVWKNETIVDGILTGQVFDARGNGTIGVESNGTDGEVTIQGLVSDAWINRSLIDGIVDEKFRLEANGSIEILNNESEEGNFSLTGVLAVLLVETHDLNGTRVLDHQEFEATADLVIEDNDTRIDISLEVFQQLTHWENGVMVNAYSNLEGHGSFGLTSSDENSSVNINGTIYDFHQASEDGLTTIDDFHLDGTISGDASGTFGVVRNIETDGQQASWNGTTYDVIVIHQEDWFNLTGIAGLPNSEIGAGAHHNESWDYLVPQEHWDNRSIRTVWQQTGNDPSSGDEVHNNSPIEKPLEQPDVEEMLGDVNVGREMGFAPLDAKEGDVFTLDHQSEMALTVTCGLPEVKPIDGHMVDTLVWTGEYSSGVGGNASGNLIVDGPLSGLNVEIERIIIAPFGEDNQTVTVTENKQIDRVLLPSIISIHDNTPPTIVSATLREGVVTGEGGPTAHLEVVISDPDYNVDSVTADLTGIGGEIVGLSDKGMQGDSEIGDDIWTTQIVVMGLELGDIPIIISATDAFESGENFNTTIEVINQPPRLAGITIVPHKIARGDILVINAEVGDGHGVASVQMDLRDEGGSLQDLERIGNFWIGEVVIPDGMSPGDHLLKVRMEDDLGASITVTRTRTSGLHHVENSDDEDVEVEVLNTPPHIDVGETRVITIGDENKAYTFTVTINDHDNLASAKIKLGAFAPPGDEGKWLVLEPNGDDTYSITVSIRSTIVIGTHEVLVRATDIYGAQSSNEPLAVIVQEEENSVISGDGPDSKLITYAAVGGMIILAIAGATIYIRRGSDGEGGGLGGFGEV
ncbi:MAG: hypothetical protein QGG96_01110 [Candidatus Poseidoniaceae archaeon]|nr:hypothetical protein [Candidatus Poseidoniaceae archaeon]